MAHTSRYDVVVLGSILLHVRDTFRALEQAANHASDVILVTEPLLEGLEGDQPRQQFWTDEADLGPSVTWWRFSPGEISTMLWRLGFERTRVVHHTQRYRMSTGHFVDTPMFTVVAQRMTAPQTSTPDWLVEARQLRDAATEFEKVRSSKIFRWTAPLRDVYRHLR